jgi:hypothetical protein
MAIKMVISDQVGIKVKGTINDPAGIPQPFDFNLVCQRLDAEQIKVRLNSASDDSISGFLVDIVESWSGVRDEDDKFLPYSADALRQLCRIPGIATLTLQTYLAEAGAKAKN